MHKFSEQTIANLGLVTPFSHCRIRPDNWRVITSWVYKLSRHIKFDYCVVANTLMLISRHFSGRSINLPSLQLYSIACVSISCNVIPNNFSTDEELLWVCNGTYTMEEFIRTRNEVMLSNNGNSRMMTAFDMLPEELVEANLVCLLCYIWDPKFTAIRQDELARACIASLDKVYNDDLTRLVVSCMSELSAWAPSNISFEASLTTVLFKFSEKVVTTASFVKQHPSFPHKVTSPESYKLGTVIGSGSYAVVYLSGENTAIKVQDMELGVALVELSILSTYKHDNLIEMISFSLDQQNLYIEMELGVSLESLVTYFGEQEFAETWNAIYMDHTCASILPESTLKERRSFADDIVRGVSYLHSMGVLHNDLKPANVILVEKNGKRVAKLADFGMSDLMVLNPQERIDTYPFAHCVPYQCPSILLEEECKCCFAPDIWAVGVLMLLLETGVEPFCCVSEENTIVETLRLISIVLGSPQEENQARLTMIEDMDRRTRILKALDYNSEKRTLQ